MIQDAEPSALARVLCEESAPAVHWLQQRFGLDLSLVCTSVPFRSLPAALCVRCLDGNHSSARACASFPSTVHGRLCLVIPVRK